MVRIISNVFIDHMVHNILSKSPEEQMGAQAKVSSRIYGKVITSDPQIELGWANNRQRRKYQVKNKAYVTRAC